MGETVGEKRKFPALERKRAITFFLSLPIPLALLLFRPFGMSIDQGAVLSALVLVIIWWSGNIVPKIPASLFLLAVFLLFGHTPVKTVLAFPLSENFLLIVICYLFSQGIRNSRIAEKTLEPFLFRHVNTPLRFMASVIAVFALTMYVIPQPLARLIIAAEIYRSFLDKTNAPRALKDVFLFGVFEFYAIMNGMCMDADIILNASAVGFSGLDITNWQWMQYMLVPTVLYALLVLGLFFLVFRKELHVKSIQPMRQEGAGYQELNKKDKLVCAVVLFTMLLWSISGLINISPTLVTAVSTIVLTGLGFLRWKDLKAIDVTTLVFLTAAFCIGGVMKFSGIADIIFAKVAPLFPQTLSWRYILVMILITMGMHLVLGSNTTTMSVLVPSLVSICGSVLPAPIILFIIYISLTPHHLLPFHSVAMMIGASNSYFPGKLVTKFGLPLMFLIVAVIFAVYIPWWRFCGFLA